MIQKDARSEFDSSSVLSDVMSWWNSMHDSYPGERNRLKRAGCLNEVQIQKGYFRLKNRLDEQGSFSNERVAVVARVLVHIRTHSEDSLGNRMIQADLHEHRFQNLLAIEDLDELADSMTRILSVLQNRASVFDTATTLYYWSDSIKQSLASTYYSTL